MKHQLRSSFSTQGRRMAGARALWTANGMKNEQMGKPIIAIVNSFTQFVPGHVHLHEIGQFVKEEIEKQGCFAAEFNTIAIDDGIAMGHDGMMLPSSSLRLKLSKMNMMGLGSRMMRFLMNKDRFIDRSDRRRGRYNQHRSNLPFGCRSRHRCRAAHPHLLRPAQPACGQGIHGVGIPRTMDLAGRSHRQTERLRFPHGSYGAYRQLHTYRQSCLDRRT